MRGTCKKSYFFHKTLKINYIKTKYVDNWSRTVVFLVSDKKYLAGKSEEKSRKGPVRHVVFYVDTELKII